MSKSIKALQAKLDAAKKEVAKLEAQMAEARLTMIRSVPMTTVGATITLEVGNRIVKAKKNPTRGRFKVTEGKKTLDSEYFGSIHDLRFALAMGTI